MKNLFVKIFLLMLISMMGIEARAYDFTQSGLCYNITSSSDRTVAVAGQTEYHATLVIPSEVTYNGVTYSVTSIANNAFYKNYSDDNDITSLTLPESIKEIGDQAFAHNRISEVDIPASVQHIGRDAFGGTFYYWYGSDSEDSYQVCYPETYTVSNDNLFYSSYKGILYDKDKTKLIDCPDGYSGDIYLPSSLKEIPSGAFNGWNNHNLYINDLSRFCEIDVTGIGGIYGSISKIYYYGVPSWSSSSNKQWLNIGDQLIIPANVTKIGRGIFYGCKSFTSVSFPTNGVTEVGDYAFARTKITDVTLPATIQTIGQNAFYEQWYEYIDTGEYDDEGDPIYETNTWTMAMSSLVIPQSVQSIGSNAFNLTSGATVTSKSTTPSDITSNAFKNASNCTLAVAQGLQSTYSQQTGWNSFGTIAEDENITPYVDGEVFSATTPDGLEMTFKVLSASKKTVQVGDGKNAAIDQSYEGDVVIPTQINGLTIKEIGNNAFRECKHLHFVDIPEDVLLGDGAFSYASIKKIIVKAAIYTNTFWCANIGELIIDSSVNYGGYDAFFKTNINRLEIKPSDTTLTYSNGRDSHPMFEDCNIGTAIIERNMYSDYYGSGSLNPFLYSDIDTLYVRRNFLCKSSVGTNYIGDIFFEGVTDIASSYYKNGISISRVHFSEGVSTIGSNAFSSFENNIILPSSLTSIGDNAISIGLSPSVTSLAQTPPSISETSFGSSNSYTIPLYVPQGCREQYASATGWNKFTNIIELGEPENVIAFADEEAKKWCLIYYDLNGDAEIDENEALRVTSLIVRGNNADKIKSFDEIRYFKNIETFGFRGCSSLQSITLPSFITTIDYNAFNYCTSLSSIGLPNSLTSIKSDAFQDCDALVSITIPNTVTSIEPRAFYKCSSLSSMSVAADNSIYDSRDECNAIIETSSNTLIAGCSNTIIPSSVTSIDSYAFNYCNNLTSLTIPNSVTSIGSGAFFKCSDLTSVTIPSSVTSIGDYAFSGCSGLTSVTIPNSVTSIGYEAFYGCGLSKVVSEIETPFAFGSSAFGNLSPSCTLTVPSGKREAYINAGWTTSVFRGGIIDLSDPGTIYLATGDFFKAKTIEGLDMSFKVMDNTQNIVQVANRTSYSSAIDNNVTGTVTIPNKVVYGGKEYTITSIGNYAFYYCSGLTSVTIPNGVTSIGNYAFYSCSGLTSVVSKIEEPFAFGSNAFRYIASTCTLTVPAGTRDAYIAAGWTEDVFKGGVVEAEPTSVIAGDANGDGEVDVFDVTEMVNYILGSPSEGFVVAAADLNGDGEVDVFDVTKAVNIILGVDVAGANMRRAVPVDETGTMLLTTNSLGTNLVVDDAERYVAMQFDVVVPTGETVKDVTLNSRTGHAFTYEQMEANRYRVIAYSMRNASFKPTEDALVSLTQARGASIENAVFVTTDGHCIHMTVTGEATGIEEMTNGNSQMGAADGWYTLDGHKLSGKPVEKGVYIRNNKKYIIK